MDKTHPKRAHERQEEKSLRQEVQETAEPEPIQCQTCKTFHPAKTRSCRNCGMAMCIHCGCTSYDSCANGCYWVMQNVCSTCFGRNHGGQPS